jgi:hypothetical protein
MEIKGQNRRGLSDVHLPQNGLNEMEAGLRKGGKRTGGGKRQTKHADLKKDTCLEVGMPDNTKVDELREDKRNSERAIDLSTKLAMLHVESIEVDKVKEVKREIKLPLCVHGPLYVIGPIDM